MSNPHAAGSLLLVLALALPAAAARAEAGEPAEAHRPVVPSLGAAGVFDADDVVATVNGRPIPEISLSTVQAQLDEAGPDIDRTAILARLIDMEVLAQAAERAGLDRRADVASALLLQYTQTLANAWLADQEAQLDFDDDALRREYDAQVATLPDSDYRAAHILVSEVSEAQTLIDALQGGADFGDLAAEHSIDANAARGGEFGWLSADTLSPALAEALADMAPGSTSARPVISDYGAHVLLLHEKRAAPQPAFETVREPLEALLARRALGERTAELRDRADIRRR